MMYITRRETFNAAHKLSRSDWSAEKNEEVFGKCANANWHGHNYELFITVKGAIDPDTGYVMDLKTLKAIVHTHIINKLDHRNLNLDVDFMAGKMASTEILAIEIFNQLNPHITTGNIALHRVRLCETENNFVDYYGE